MMKQLLSLLLCLCSASLYAASNDDFGRLFSRPSERSTLDKLRQNQQLKIETVPAVTPAITLATPDPVSLQGYVKRGDGKKSTLWINNQAVQEDSTLGNVHIGRLNQRRSTQGAAENLAREGVDVTVSANAQPIRLQAGQMYVPDSNQIKALAGVEK